MTSVQPESKEVKQSETYKENPRRIVRQGFLIVFLFFGVLGALAIFGELSGAIVTPGTVRVDTYSKKVQHLEGGIIDTILVKEGSKVHADQVLLTLQNVNTEASVDFYRKLLASSLATQARLLAEKELSERITWPAELLKLVEEYSIQEILEGEDKLFNSRMQAFRSENSMLESQMLQIDAQVAGLNEQAMAEQTIVAAFQEEYHAKEQLFRDKYIDKAQLLELRRQIATHKGAFGRLGQSIAELLQRKDELKLRIQDLTIRFVADVHKELSALEKQITQTREQIKPYSDARNRLNVLSPASGYVVNLKVHTKGGVIQPGEALMEVVPDNVPLIVEARIPVDKIADVYLEQEAQVQMDAFDIRTTPLLAGKVIYISADRMEEQSAMGPTSYYLCHVEVPQGALVEARVYLSPGMPVTVYITTGKRTILNYMFEPLQKNWERALRD